MPDYLPADELKRLFPGISPDVLARSAARPVGGLPNPQRQSDQRRQGTDRQLDKSAAGMGYRVTIISIRRRLVDAHDNLRTGAKPTVDCITRSLGFASDDNPRLAWNYHQFKTDGRQGTVVMIERTKP